MKHLETYPAVKVVVLHASGDLFCAGGRPHDWVSTAVDCDIVTNQFETVASVVNEGVKVCCRLWEYLSITVIAVLHQ